MSHYQQVKQDVTRIARQCGRDPAEITTIAVSKTYPAEAIQKVYSAGCRDFGESRVQEVLQKIPMLPADILWHFIGTLQLNKVNKAVGHFSLIHAVDSFELAQKISSASLQRGLTTPILLQVNTSGEASKHGLTEESWRSLLESLCLLPALNIAGLMTMAPLVEDEAIIRECFRNLRLARDDFRSRVAKPEIFTQLSMGMSHDYPLAIEEGATLLRIGTAIFGERE